MQKAESQNTIYILLNGIELSTSIKLSENVELLSADTSHLDLNTAISTCSRPDDIAVVAAFIPRITAQLKIVALTSKELVAIAWNSSWRALLLSAIFNTEIGFNLQSDTEAGLISSESCLIATNLHMHGLTQKKPYNLNLEDIDWITQNFESAYLLIDNEKFQTAVHCMASYRWHTMPRIQMAVIWAGIEGMFGASSEIRFRISIYVSRFLHPTDLKERKSKFEAVKKLYNLRSSAIHGSKMKGDLVKAVEESAELLRNLIRQCVINRELPIESDLVP